MKKVLISLLAIITIFTLTGCGSSSNSSDKIKSHPNQKEYIEGQYFIDDLTFSLPEGFKPSFQENIYQLADDNNIIVIYFYHDKDVKISLEEYIEKDEHDFLPNKEKIEPATINGNKWSTGVTDDNAYIYYNKDGSDVYSIMIMPMSTTKTVLNNLITKLEYSLFFKQ